MPSRHTSHTDINIGELHGCCLAALLNLFCGFLVRYTKFAPMKIPSVRYITITQFDASAPGILLESNGFDRRPISNGPVSQLQWQSGAEVIYAITDTAVSYNRSFSLGRTFYISPIRLFKSQLLTVPLSKTVPVALRMATLCVAGV